MGTPEFAVPSLRRLHHSDHEVISVVTSPDKPAGRSLKLCESEVKVAAKGLRIPILQPEQLNDPSFLDEIRRIEADIGVVVAFRILPPSLFELFPKGCVNLHPSKLPDLRGAAPINWALIRGYTETGITTFLIEKRVDVGNILLQTKVSIDPDDDAGRLSERVSEMGAQLIVQTLDGIEKGELKPTPQEGKVTLAPKITRELCEINWDKSASELRNLIRGVSPIPCAFTYLNGKMLKIFKATVLHSSTKLTVGSVIGDCKDEIRVQCGEGMLLIDELQLEGKKRMTSGEFLRGRTIPKGTILG